MARFTNPNAIEGKSCLRGDILLKSAAQLNKQDIPDNGGMPAPKKPPVRP